MANAPPPPVWSDRGVSIAGTAPPGGFWLRFVAYFIDSFILGFVALVVVGIAAGIIIALGEPADSEEEALAAVAVVPLLAIPSLLIVSWLYEALLTSSARGATIGKQALGLRIIRADGAPLSFGRATARHFLKVLITPMTFVIGYLMAAFTTRKRALHDVLADTLVIRSR